MNRGARASEWAALYALSSVIALVLSSGIVEATGGDWWPALEALVGGSVQAPGRWGVPWVIFLPA